MSTSIPLTPQQRAQKWGTAAKWASIGLAGFLFAPFALATIQGLIGLIIAGGIILGVWIALPTIQSAAINLRLRLLKVEAAKNPIETLEAEHLRRSMLLEERKNAIETFDAKTRTFGDKLEGFKKQYPSEAPKFQATHDQMKLLLKRQREQWTEANRGLTLFSGEVRKAKAMWDMAIAADAARAGSGLDEESFYAQLKVETSLDAISDGMNRAFSQLDTLVMEGSNDPATLPAADSRPVINVTPAPTSAKA